MAAQARSPAKPSLKPLVCLTAQMCRSSKITGKALFKALGMPDIQMCRSSKITGKALFKALVFAHPFLAALTL
jgi:hypothetical protein